MEGLNSGNEAIIETSRFAKNLFHCTSVVTFGKD